MYTSRYPRAIGVTHLLHLMEIASFIYHIIPVQCMCNIATMKVYPEDTKDWM
jgi:hypothetical protein